MLLPIRGGFALSAEDVKRRLSRLAQKAMHSQDASTVEMLMVHWERLEPVLEAAVRGGGRDDDILRDVLRPALQRLAGASRRAMA